MEARPFSFLPQPSHWLEKMSGDKGPSVWGPRLAWDSGGPLGWVLQNSVSWYPWQQVNVLVKGQKEKGTPQD